MIVRLVESTKPIIKTNAGDIIMQTPITDKRESKESEYIQPIKGELAIEQCEDEDYFSFISKQLQSKHISPETACNMIVFRIIKIIYKDAILNDYTVNYIDEMMIKPLNEVLLMHMNSIYNNSESIISDRLDAMRLIVYEVLDILHPTDDKIKRIDKILNIIKDWF